MVMSYMEIFIKIKIKLNNVYNLIVNGENENEVVSNNGVAYRAIAENFQLSWKRLR